MRRWIVGAAFGVCLGMITFLTVLLLGTKLFYCADAPGEERCAVQNEAYASFRLIGLLLAAGVVLLTTIEVQTILERRERRATERR